MKKIIHITIALVLVLVSCSERKDAQHSWTKSPECCEDSAMAHFLTEPERSIALLDSAVALQRLTPQRGEYLKAMVVYCGLKKPDSCIVICQKMLDEKVYKHLPDSVDPVGFQAEVYELMANAAYSTSNLLALQRYAKAGIELIHGRKDMLSDEADMLSRLGIVMVYMGQTEEGLQALDQAQLLVRDDNEWPSHVTYLNISKKYIRAYDFAEDYKGMCRVAKDALSRLDSIRKVYKSIEYLPRAMYTDSTALEEFVQYYYAPFTSNIAKAYTLQGDINNAKEWYDRFMTSSESGNPAVSSAIITPLIAFGEYEDAMRRIQASKEFLDTDTLSESYIQLLEQEMDIYLKMNRKDEALALSHRILDITKQHNTNDYKTLMANTITQFWLQQEQLKREEAEKKLYSLILLIISVAVLVISCVIGYYIRKIRLSRLRLSSALEQAESKIHTLETKETEQSEQKSKTPSPQELFHRAKTVMENDRPFINSKYTIDDLSRQTFTNRAYLSAAINQISGMTFRNWLAKYRVEYAKQIMQEQPDISISKLAQMCGFDGRNTFYRQFSNFEGVTPTEWKEKSLPPNSSPEREES